MRKILFIIMGLLLFLSSACADVLLRQGFVGLSSEALAKEDDFVLSGYTEVGKRSTAEDYEEEDTDEDYTFQNYHLKFAQEVSPRLSYDLSSFIYDKNYKSLDSLDNISKIFKTQWSYYLKKLKPEGSGLASDRPQGHGLASFGQSHSHKEESLRIDFDLKYKEKRYDNSPVSEYDQLRAVPTFVFKKDLWTVNLSSGIDNYDYLAVGEKDQLKVFTNVEGKRYFLDKRLMVNSAYKIETLEQKIVNRKRSKQEVMAGFDYLFSLPWLYKITTRLGWGQKDTKEDEERDQDYDYEYWRYYAKTEHRTNPKLKTELKYQYFKKDYVSADLDHRGFYIGNSWDYEILDDEKQKFWLELGLEYKDVNYHLKSANDYLKETIESRVTYQRKKNYKLSVTLEENFYDFNDSGNDKKRTYVKLSAEKLFLKEDLILSLDFKYRYTNYEQRDDAQQEAVRLAFRYRF